MNIKYVLFFSGVVAMAIIFSGCIFQKGLEKYSSQDPELGVTMDYFSGWTLREDRGSYGSYVQALFLEPVRKGKPLRACMDLTAVNESKVKFQPLTTEAFLEDWMKKWQRRKGVKILSTGKSEVSGNTAFVIDMTYQELKSPDLAKADFIPVQERAILWKRHDRFYMIRHVNTVADFRMFDKKFSRCVESLRFKK
jgi:hypothetical protein